MTVLSVRHMHTAEGQLLRAKKKKKMQEAVGREAVHKRSRMWRRRRKRGVHHEGQEIKQKERM